MNEPRSSHDPLDDVYGFETFSHRGLRVPKKDSILLELEREEREILGHTLDEIPMDETDHDEFKDFPKPQMKLRDPETYLVPNPQTFREKFADELHIISETSSSVTFTNPKPDHPLHVKGKRYEVQNENTQEIEVKYEPEPEQVKLYFGVHRKNLRKYMNIDTFPEGFPSGVRDEFDSTRTQRLMIRDPVVSYAGRIKAFESGVLEKGPDPFTLLTGERGTGKSSTLVQIVQFCRERDWIVLYANDCREWSQLQQSWEVSDVRLDRVTFDQPEFASNLLKCFLDAHQDKLENIPLTRVKSSRESENLAQYINEALEKRNDDDTLDPDGVLIGVMDELNNLTDHKVLIALDGFNWLYEDVPYEYNFASIVTDDDEPLKLRELVRDYMKENNIEDELLDRNDFVFGSTRLRPEQMTLMNQFRYLEPGHDGLTRTVPRNGFVVAATSEFHPIKYDSKRFRQECDTKHVELRHEKGYNRKELQRCMDFYASQSWLTVDPTIELSDYFAMRWGRNPEGIRKGAVSPMPKEF